MSKRFPKECATCGRTRYIFTFAIPNFPYICGFCRQRSHVGLPNILPKLVNINIGCHHIHKWFHYSDKLNWDWVLRFWSTTMISSLPAWAQTEVTRAYEAIHDKKRLNYWDQGNPHTPKSDESPQQRVTVIKYDWEAANGCTGCFAAPRRDCPVHSGNITW